MKSKVILFCVLLFCSKIVDSIPHSENHVRQRVSLPSNWQQVNQNVPNAQYLDTDFTQPQNVNKLTNSAVQQENNEDNYSNQRGFNYDSYGYIQGPASSPSAKELFVNYDSPADGRRLDSYPPRVESYPSHTSQVGFDHQQYRNKKYRSHNPFINSVPSSVLIPNDEMPLVTPVQEPYRVLAQYEQPKYVPSSNRRFYNPGRSYLTSEQLQYPSVDHSGVNKYVVNPATRFGSRGLVPFENYSESQASVSKTRPTGVRRQVQDFETPSKINYESPAVDSADTLVDRPENLRYPVPYENYREAQVSDTKTRLAGVHKYVQDFETPSEINYETPAVESSDTLVDQSENIRYPVPYENYREGQVSETKTRLTEVRRHKKDFETPTEINYETPALESLDALVDQSENVRYPVPYENYREGQVSETETRLTGVRRHVQDFKTPSEINYETSAVESPDTLAEQSENIRYPVPYENYREGQVSETKTRLTGVRRHAQDFKTPSKINNETPPEEFADTVIDQSENVRNPVPYENYREGQVSETKTRLAGVRRHVQGFETPSEINYETSAVESPDTVVDQSENVRYPVPYENYREGQVSETKTRLTGARRHAQDFKTPSKINNESPPEESADTVVDQSENVRYPVPYDNYREGHVSETKTRLAGVRRHVQGFETPSEINYETPAVESPDTDNYSSDSRPSNLAPVFNVKKEATVETLADKPLARKYAHRTDYERSNIGRDNSNNDASSDIIKTVEVKEGKYGATYAEEKTVPINTYPEDSLTPTNTALENSYTYEESNVPQHGSSSPNNSKQNAIHHLTSEIKELSLKSLVANPEIQHILSRTDKRYVVVHSNGTIEYLDTLPLDSQQDSKLHLVHTKRKNIDGSEGDEVLTPQWPQNISSNIVKTAPVDEYQWPTNNQPVDEYDSNRVISFENLPTGHSHLKPLLSHVEQPADNKNSKPLPPPVNQSADGGYSKPLIPNEDQPVDDTNSNQPKEDDNLKSLAPNETEPPYDANPKPTPENLSGDDENSNPLPNDVNHSTDDDILKHWTSPENQPRDDDSPIPLLTDVNQSKDKIILTPYARNHVHVKRHKHAFVTHPANDNTFKSLLPNEAQSSDDSIHVEPFPAILQPAHDTKPKHSHGNQPENDDNSKPSSPVIEQLADDKKSELFNENPSGDEIVFNLLNSHYRQHKKSKHSHVNKPADDNSLNPSSTPEPLTETGADNDSKPLLLHKRNRNSASENQPAEDKTSKPLLANENDISPYKQPGDDNTPTTSNGNQLGDETDSTSSRPHKKQPAHYKKSNHSNVNKQENDNSNTMSPEKKQLAEDNVSKLLPSIDANQLVGETDSTTLLSHKKHRRHHKKPKNPRVDLESEDNNANPLSQDENQQRGDKTGKNQSGDDYPAQSFPTHDNQSGDNKKSKPSDTNENQTGTDNDSELPLHKTHPAYRHKSKKIYENQYEDDDNSNTASENQPAEDKRSKYLSTNENDISSYKQPEDDNTPNPKTLNANQLGDETDSTPSLSYKKHRRHHKKPKNPRVDLESEDNNANPLSQDEKQQRDDKAGKNQSGDDYPAQFFPTHDNQSGDKKKSKPSDTNENQTGTDNDSELPLYKTHPAHRHKSKKIYGNQHEDDDNSNSASENQPAEDKGPKHLSTNENDISSYKQPEDDNTPKTLNGNQLGDETDSTPLQPNKKQRAHLKKSKYSKANKKANDNNSNPATPEKTQLAEDNGSKILPSIVANQLGGDNDSTPSLLRKKQRKNHKKPKEPHFDLEPEDNNASPSSQDENQHRDDKADENQSDETVTTTLPLQKKQQVHHKKAKPSRVNKSVDDNNSKTSPDETQTKDDKKSKSLPTSEDQSTNDNYSKSSPLEENQPEDDIKSKLTPSVSSKNDDESRSSTLSPTVPSYTPTPKPQAIKKYNRKYSHRKTKTNSPVVSTTLSPDDSSEDQIIALSPIEQVTDNVSDVPTLTTTTAKPVETPDQQDTYKYVNNKPDEAHDDTKSSSEDLVSISDKVQTSTTTATSSSSTSPTDNASNDDKTKGKSEENENKAVVSKENSGKDNTQTAEYNSSELIETNTDVSEETDDYLPVTPSPSVQNDVDTGDASGDNSSELEQCETDVTITVSSSTTYDSEDEIITINIEVSESTDDADSPSNDKTLVVSIDTNPDNDDDSKALQTDVPKTTKTEDCKEDHNHDDGRGKKVEIDLSNLKVEPTMWIKTTNQDFIENLTAKNDTQFDVIYFFSIENQPIIEREKETTIFCNGTVVIETTEITYAHKDDPTPTIVKTTETMQIENY